MKPDNTLYVDPLYETADSKGNYTHFYDSSAVSLFGTYKYYAKDIITGKQSPQVSFIITP